MKKKVYIYITLLLLLLLFIMNNLQQHPPLRPDGMSDADWNAIWNAACNIPKLKRETNHPPGSLKQSTELIANSKYPYNIELKNHVSELQFTELIADSNNIELKDKDKDTKLNDDTKKC